MTVEAATGRVGRLRQRIADGRIIVVAGAGVSIGATMRDGTQHPCASWAGLVRSGVEEMADYGAPAEAVTYARSLLVNNQFAEAADLITKYLGNFYAEWLQRSFDPQDFRITDFAVPKALHALGCPILTTNYDDVLERATTRAALEWRNAEAWPQVKNEPTRYVLHIHGIFTDSKSVVFSTRDYEKLLDDTASQSLWRSLATEYSLLFIGVGKSFEDPNFDRLGGYLADVLGQAGQDHYRLVHAGQDDGVDRDELFGQKILYIEYGTSPADLPEFLTGLVPSAPEAAAPGSTVPRLPPPAVLRIHVGDEKVMATLHADKKSPEQREAQWGLNETTLETLSLFDEWIRNDPLAALGAGDREGMRARVIQQMGRILFDAVFRGEVSTLYQDALRYQAQRRDASTPLEIVLTIKKKIVQVIRPINLIDLDDLPWELLWEHSNGHLAASPKVVLVRGTQDQSGRFQAWQPLDRLNVLVALAQPEDLVSQVRASWPEGKGYDSVIADIRSAIGAWDPPANGADRGSDPAQDRDGGAARGRIHVFELDGPSDMSGGNGETPAARSRCRVTWERFKAAFDTSAQAAGGSVRHVDVVHFIGHAGVTGLNRYVAFEAPEGKPQWVSFEEIDTFVRSLDDNDRPTLVMLQLCQGPVGGVNGPVGPLDMTRASFSQLGYLLMQAQIPLVVAMQYPMWPDAGAVFTRTFYSRVETATVPQAIQAARNAVFRTGAGASGPVGPVFFMGADVRQILIPQPDERPGEAAVSRAAGRVGTTRTEVSTGTPVHETIDSGRAPDAFGSDRFQQSSRAGGTQDGG